MKVLERGGVVGGTSAGAAIMSRMMIRYGSPKAVVGAGFNLLARAVVDQHFIRRHRQERLLGVLAEHPELVGLGIDEGAALVVQGDHLRVIGESQVIICKTASGATSPWIESLKPGDEVDLVAGETPADEARRVERGCGRAANSRPSSPCSRIAPRGVEAPRCTTFTVRSPEFLKSCWPRSVRTSNC